jgi:hypothetical protein
MTDAEIALQRWQNGDCFCCGSDLYWYGTPYPEPVAEGVMMCGRCTENEHNRNGALMPLLRAMAEYATWGTHGTI